MKDDCIPYKESAELKELEFNEQCFYYYRLSLIEDDEQYKDTELIRFRQNYDNHNHRLDCQRHQYDAICTAPLYQQVFDWFEDNHSIFIDRKTYTNVNEIMDIEYSLKSWKFPPIKIEFENPYDCFDRNKARLVCLKKLIEIIK